MKQQIQDDSLSCLSGYKFNSIQAFSCSRDEFYKLLTANVENQRLELQLTGNIVKNRIKLKDQIKEMDREKEMHQFALTAKNEQIKNLTEEMKAKDEMIESKYREINKKLREMSDMDKVLLEKDSEVKELQFELKEKDMVIRDHEMNEERDRIKMREVEVVHNDFKLKKKELKVKEKEMKVMEESIKVRMNEIPTKAPRKPQYQKVQVQEEQEVEDEMEDEIEVEEEEVEGEESEQSDESDESRVTEPALPEITPAQFKKIYDDVIGGEPFLCKDYELSLCFNKPSHLAFIIAIKQYKLPKIKELEFDKVPEGNFHINQFLQRSFPESVKSFVFNWINMKVLDLDDYIDSLVSIAPKVLEKFTIGNLKINDRCLFRLMTS
jgi:hypothetical protein